MAMAQFCARVRKRPDLPSVSMKDVYRHPTIRAWPPALRGHATRAPPLPPRRRRPPVPPTGAGGDQRQRRAVRPLRDPAAPVLPRVRLSHRAGHRPGLRVDLRQRRPCSTATCGRSRSAARLFLGMCILPILAKWVLIGRWKPRQIRIWSLALRPLLDRQDAGPGEPAGAVQRIAAVPALPAGAGREDRTRRRDPLQPHAGLHRPAHHRRGHGHPQGLVLHRLPGPRRPDPDRRGHPRQGRAARREDRARHRDLDGRRGPAGPRLLPAHRAGRPGRRTWHGSPGEPTDVDYRVVGPAGCAKLARGVGYALEPAANLVFLYLPLAIGGLDILLPRSCGAGTRAARPRALTSRAFYLDALVISFVFSFASASSSACSSRSPSRGCSTWPSSPTRPTRCTASATAFHRSITRMTNSKFFMNLFGDSSYIVPFLRHSATSSSRSCRPGRTSPRSSSTTTPT